jgi:hypothetical protein
MSPEALVMPYEALLAVVSDGNSQNTFAAEP